MAATIRTTTRTDTTMRRIISDETRKLNAIFYDKLITMYQVDYTHNGAVKGTYYCRASNVAVAVAKALDNDRDQTLPRRIRRAAGGQRVDATATTAMVRVGKWCVVATPISKSSTLLLRRALGTDETDGLDIADVIFANGLTIREAIAMEQTRHGALTNPNV